jgi:hypothetical protein
MTDEGDAGVGRPITRHPDADENTPHTAIT